MIKVSQYHCHKGDEENISFMMNFNIFCMQRAGYTAHALTALSNIGQSG
jgi:hypothetical protein